MAETPVSLDAGSYTLTGYNLAFTDALTESISVTSAAAIIYRYAKTATDTVDVTPTLLAQDGGIIAEVLGLSETLAPSTTFSMSLAQALEIADIALAAQSAVTTDTVNVTPVPAVGDGAWIAEVLNLTPALAAETTYNLTLTQAIELTDILARYIGGTLTDAVDVSFTQTLSFAAPLVLSESVTIEPSATPALILRLSLEDATNLTDVEALNAIYTGAISEAVEISALRVDPGNGITAWAVNTKLGAVTEYTNWAFNSFAEIGNQYLGASSNGLYELDGDTDAATNIIAKIKSGQLQIGGSRFTALKGAYLGLRGPAGSGKFTLRIETGDGKTYDYNVVSKNQETARVHMGKGIRTRYISFELTGVGDDFDLDTVEFVPIVARRRV